MSTINNIESLEEGIKKIFSSSENIYFHNKNYRVKIDSINMKIIEKPRLLIYTFCFFLITKDKNTENIITKDNYINESREGGKISFDNRIYDCFNFDIERRINDEHRIVCGFRIEYIDFKRKGMIAIIDASEYYDFNKKRINIPFTRFEIMDI